jgi:hypothetical protein
MMKRRSLKSMLGRIRPPRPTGQGPGRIRRAEQEALAALGFVPKPRAQELDNLLELAGGGQVEKKAFDGLLLPQGVAIDFGDKRSIRKHLRRIIFIEVKTTSRANVDRNFRNYYFSVSENELAAARFLGRNYRFALFNRRTGDFLLLTLDQLLARIRFWHVSHSVQL